MALCVMTSGMNWMLQWSVDSWDSMEVVSHVIVKSFNVVIVLFFSLDHVPLKNGAEFFGSGLDQIWLDNSVCNGDESSLLECNTNSIGQHNCDHSEDAGVICNGIVVVNVLNLMSLTII